MNVYLQDIPLPVAWQRLIDELSWTGRWGVLGSETVPLDEHACGRVLTEPVWAKLTSPHYHASAMDGFALRAVDSAGASPTMPVNLEYGRQTIYLDTGDPLPEWADAVIPIEQVEALDTDGGLAGNLRRPAAIRIRETITPWRHVRPFGEDLVAGELVLPAGHSLRPVDLGALAACGHSSVEVARRPRVAVLPTGSELVPVGQLPETGEMIEFNSIVLSAQASAWGAEVSRLPITADDEAEIARQLRIAADNHDLILLNAGSSAGAEDYSARVIERLGKILVHGVAVRPGHPVIIGIIPGANDQPVVVIGVPGYPVSAALTGEIFVEPLLARWSGRNPTQPIVKEATLTRKLNSPAGDDDYVRVALGRVGGRMLAAPLARGAGVISSLVRADGLVIVPRGVPGMAAGTAVKVRLARAPAEIEQTILGIGSHDMCLDLLAQYLAQHDRRLSSVNVGSQAGLIALRRGEAHFAGAHLLDPETGEYNLPFLAQYLPGIRVRVIGFVLRQQGLIVRSGNPLNIREITDLTRPEIRYVNRQRGAGTRVLFDYQLNLKGIASSEIRGYDHEEYTHLAIAAAVAAGRADCGLGIRAAAQALELDFVELFQERYDLIVPVEYAESDLFAPVLKILSSTAFQAAVKVLPGYDPTPMGTIIAEVNSQ